MIKYSRDKFDNQIEVLKKRALNSELHYKHSACLLKGDKILKIGINKYFKTLVHNNTNVKLSIHAEIDALFKLDQRLLTKGMDILIIRIGKSDKLRNSRPCNSCIDKLQQKGIRKAYYSDGNGEIVCEFIDHMTKMHISSGNKYLMQNK